MMFSLGISGFALGNGQAVGGGAGAPLSISGTPPAAKVGSAYSFPATISGGTAPYTRSLGSGSLPAGLSISGTLGVTGTPTGI